MDQDMVERQKPGPKPKPRPETPPDPELDSPDPLPAFKTPVPAYHTVGPRDTWGSLEALYGPDIYPLNGVHPSSVLALGMQLRVSPRS